ncbi:unnamed protein product [Cuscuta epithymum]|uniref:Pectinesterase inhibitor domain-containing protein n=1 Tax=Cuscuta epithymum TaxID=186058 RepID=A0AAV0G076_9ASTE|nr:unnamed protein product [Cuscuta epithymum]
MTCNTLHFFTLTMIIFFSTIIVSYSADARPHFSRFCVKAIDKPFCSKVVHGTKTWKDAMKKAVKTTYRHAKRAKPLVENLIAKLPSTVPPAAKYSICDTCKDSYNSVIRELHASIAVVKNGRLNLMLSAAYTDLEDCSRAFLDFNVPTKNQLFKSNEVTAKLISTCLAVEKANPK